MRSRKIEILKAGCDLWPHVSSSSVGNRLGLSRQGVLHHFDGVAGLRSEVAAYAVRTGRSEVIAQLIATRHPAISEMSDAKRLEHLRECN